MILFFLKVKDDTGTITMISWIPLKIEPGQTVKIFGKITKERNIVVSNLQNVISQEEKDSHTLLVTRHKLRNIMKKYVQDCLEDNDDDWVDE